MKGSTPIRLVHHAITRWMFCAFILLTCLSSGIARAEIRLPQVFGSHMVLQQEKPIIIWGWANPGETVKVQLAETTQSAQANERGEWKVALPAMKATGPLTLTVSGSSTVMFDDVMIGEVWLCSGQSNMELGVGMVNNAKEELANANHPGLRLLMVENRWTPQPQDDISGTWKVCAPESVAAGGWNGFSATAYFFGRELNEKLGVAVGLVDADWGGTRIESWTPPEGFAAVPALKDESEKVQLGDPRTALHRERLEQTLDGFENWIQAARKAMAAQGVVPPEPAFPDELKPPHDLQQATALYNGMIHPLAPFGIRGAIWYQGEANVGEGMRYADHMSALVTGWRTVWAEGDFPFYFVQIAPFDYGGNQEAEADLWEAQTAAAGAIPNAGMAVINDIGNLHDIHPRDKQSVGHRLASLALAKTYGQKEVAFSGPTFSSMTVAGENIHVKFDHPGGGHVQLRQLGVEDGFLVLDVAAARFPADGGAARGEHEIDHGVAGAAAALQRHGLRRKHVHIQIDQGNGRPVDKSTGHGEGEARIAVQVGDGQLVMNFNIEGAGGLRHQLLGDFRARRGGLQLEGFREVHFRQNSRIK